MKPLTHRHTLQSIAAVIATVIAAAGAIATTPTRAAEPVAAACTDFYAHINGQWVGGGAVPRPDNGVDDAGAAAPTAGDRDRHLKSLARRCRIEWS